ncbi:MAG: TrmB family transcriptional regulator [Candidatus Asgardarchaeia archaeon]
MIDIELVNKLINLGLSKYEAYAYLALVMLGSGTGPDIAKIANIPETSVYRALEKLIRKGWVASATGRPTLYTAVDPERVKEQIISEINTVFSKIKDIHGSLEKEKKKEIIFTIFGKERVLRQIQEIISNAKEFILISAPSFVLEEVKDLLEEKKDVKIRIISDTKLAFENKQVELKVYKPLLALDLLVDNRESLISMPDFSVCGWVSNPFIANHFGQFLKMRWKLSTIPSD